MCKTIVNVVILLLIGLDDKRHVLLFNWFCWVFK